MWNGIGWYGFIGVITTSTTDISLEFGLRLFGIIDIPNKVSRNVSQNCRLLHLFELKEILTSLYMLYPGYFSCFFVIY